MLEQLRFPKIDPEVYADYAEARMELPGDLTQRTGMDPEMVRLAGRIQHRNVVWAVSPGFTESKCGAQGRLTPVRSGSDPFADQRRERSDQRAGKSRCRRRVSSSMRRPMTIFLPKAGPPSARIRPFWDDHFVAEALAATDPKTAIDTLAYWLGAQLPDGGASGALAGLQGKAAIISP